MKKLTLIILIVLLPFSSVQAVDEPADLDALLEKVKREGITERQQNKARESAFIAARNDKSRLLAETKAQLVREDERMDRLSRAFQDNEKTLAEKEALLQEKSASLGELFGTVRQMAGDSRSLLASSMVSAQLPDRITLLTALAERKQQPTIEELRQFWLILQEEMTESGKISRFSIPVVTVAGNVMEKQVTRVGVFSAFSDGAFLRYLPETGKLVELGRQPVARLRVLASEFEQKQDGSLHPVVIDPTRGAIMALLVQTPNLRERINQGGWIGFIILGLGAVALMIALQRFISLTITNRGINRQLKQKQADRKNPLGRIVSVYSEAATRDIETLALKLDEAILREVPMIERGLITLAVLAAIAPMLGLLGTVSGMIETFQSITLFGTGDPKLMSGGISQALVTTELGLAVAIPILLIHSALSAKSNRLIHILDEESTALVAKSAEQVTGK